MHPRTRVCICVCIHTHTHTCKGVPLIFSLPSSCLAVHRCTGSEFSFSSLVVWGRAKPEPIYTEYIAFLLWIDISLHSLHCQTVPHFVCNCVRWLHVVFLLITTRTYIHCNYIRGLHIILFAEWLTPLNYMGRVNQYQVTRVVVMHMAKPNSHEDSIWAFASSGHRCARCPFVYSVV